MHTLQTTIIEKVNSPADVKALNLVEMEQLAGEIRSLVLNKVSQVSGHVGPEPGRCRIDDRFPPCFRFAKGQDCLGRFPPVLSSQNSDRPQTWIRRQRKFPFRHRLHFPARKRTRLLHGGAYFHIHQSRCRDGES